MKLQEITGVASAQRIPNEPSVGVIMILPKERDQIRFHPPTW